MNSPAPPDTLGLPPLVQIGFVVRDLEQSMRQYARLYGPWQRFLGTVGPWLRLVERQGAEAVLAAYQQVLAGTVDPAEGFLLSL